MEAVMKSKQVEPVVPVIDAAVLPKGWELTTIDAVCGKVEKTDPTQRPSEEFKYIDIGGIDNQALRIVDTKAYLGKDAPSRARQVVKAHDVVVSTVRTYLKNIALVPEELDGEVCSTGFCVLRGGNEWMGKYLYYFIQSDAVLKEIGKQQRGTSYPAVRDSDIKAQFIPLAPLPEQRRIVSAIETQLGRLDAAVARLHAAKAKLKRYKQAVLKAAFSGDMTEAWRAKAKVTPVDKMLARIETPPRPSRYKSRSMDVVDGDYALAIGAPERQGPTGWKWLPLVDIARLESGHTPSKRHPEYWDGDVPWIELRDARDRHGATIHTTTYHTNQLGLDNSAARLLPAGTVCLSRTASVGYVVKMGVPMCTSQDFVNWVCTEAIDPDWLKLLFVAEHDAIWRFGKGTTHTTVYFPEVVSFHVLLPPIEEQREIVRLVADALTTTEEIEATLDAQLLKSTRLRQAVLKRAFEGRLVSSNGS
ncbi:MAG: restriction endonuclease subunit S [Flavobacteriales bacterium]|nr:restriction endonuclease subunit S [Flavobacteriales bacterium]